METFFLILFGCVVGYIVRGWFIKFPESYIHTDTVNIEPIPYQYKSPTSEIKMSFEDIWLSETKHRDYDAVKGLTDDEYIKQSLS